MIQRFFLPGVTLLALATCASAPNTAYYGRGTCEPRGAVSPDGECRAGSAQFWDENGLWAQVTAGCKVEGLNYITGLAGYDGHAEHGVALHWLSNDHLEVVLPPGAVTRRPSELRVYSDTAVEVSGQAPKEMEGSLGTDVSLVRAVQITYRDLTPKDPEWRHGCYLKRPKAKKS